MHICIYAYIYVFEYTILCLDYIYAICRGNHPLHTQLIHISDTTHVYMGHDTMISVTGLIV